jgi:predicted kinase
VKTRLIIVGGSPGSGKTTRANRLKHEFGFPLFSKDTFKDALMDVSLPADRPASSRIGLFAWSAMYTALDAVLGTVPGAILEANFTHGYAEPNLTPRLARCSGLILHCVADRDTILARIRSRQNDPDRHAGHFDQDAIPDLLRILDVDGYRLDDLGVPVIEVDTSNDYRPGIDEILAAINAPA